MESFFTGEDLFMKTTLLHPLTRWAWLGLAALSAVCQAGAPVKTGSQATFVHYIQLFDENGQLLNVKSKVPYSTKKTCGKCHDYEKISGGWHFQAGLREMPEPNHAFAEFASRLGEPFFLTQPASATQIPISYRNWAQRKGMTPTDLGLSQFDFLSRYGAHLPGGGMLENTRDKAGKIQHLSGEPWAKTGVLEIDCLICHLRKGYNPEERKKQIGYKNLKWAATYAAGFGVVKGEAGKAAEGEQEESGDAFERETQGGSAAAGGTSVEVVYNPQTFDVANFVTLDLTRHVPNTNCLFCHYTRTTHRQYGIDQKQVVDIHYDAGLTCTTCHRNGLDHMITRGDGGLEDLAATDDNRTLTCKGCHRRGRAAAPRDDHPGLPEFHLKVISCTACHSGPLPGTQVVAEQTSIAHNLGISTEADLSKLNSPAIWTSVWRRDPVNGKIGFYRYAYPQWFGKKADQKISPLPLSAVDAALKAAGQAVKDDDKDGTAEVDTDAEISAVLAALGKTLAAKDKNARPVMVARGGLYEPDASGKVTWAANPIGEPYRWATAHMVRPARESAGSRGCTDCHSGKSPFYFMTVCKDNDPNSKAKTTSYELLGAKPSLARIGGWREGFVKTTCLGLLPIVAALCLLHYVTFGPKRIDEDGSKELIPRFDFIERVMHLVLLVSCLLLAATGLGFLLAKLPEARAGFWTSHDAKELHEACGWVFGGAIVVALLRWFRTALPAAYDWEWVKVFGGYLWIKEHPPAGKFNFGQKMLFWGAMALGLLLTITGITMWAKPGGDDGWATLAYTLHDIAAVLMLLLLVAHIYLATIANPGTLISIFAGKVYRAWASFHHPNWVKEVDQAAGRKPSTGH
jgi:formate dehydrogenase gamma subunit